MARARISAGTSIRRKAPKNNKMLLLLGLNIVLSSVILLKLFGVI